MTVVAAAIVDSRNLYHQSGDAVGLRARPSVTGVREALRHYGLDAAAVHVGLALARPRDRQVLAQQHATNETYRQRVLSEGGDVLLGELHSKASGSVEEKMVDSACCVRITRYVDEIAAGTSAVEAIAVLSKDIDLTPAVDYAVAMNVPITVAALDVVQHRGHPYALLGPTAYASMAGAAELATGHEYRELLVCALHDSKPLAWTVRGTSNAPWLQHASGIRGMVAPGVPVPPVGHTVQLLPIDVTWEERLLGSFPLLLCSRSRPAAPTWVAATVRRRTAPLSVEFDRRDGPRGRAQYAMGGLVPGEVVLVHAASGRVLGRLLTDIDRKFDPDRPQLVRVVTSLPRGGGVVVDDAGQRGLLNTQQRLKAGHRIPAIQVDLKAKGPVWAAIGTVQT